LLVKKGFLIRGLSDECQKVLKELLDVRIWSFHNAQSMLVAELENAKKSIIIVVRLSVEYMMIAFL